jgi:aldehyde dehydrogenase (NAD+)/gamma-glutamyl-gamma-aminobutyraldehyde dehydrogenase
MRQIVHAKVKDAFLGKVLESIRALKVGDPLDPSTQMGSMISEEHQRRVLGYIAKGEKEGAKILQGSAKPLDRAGYYVAPTVFDEVAPGMTIAREEVFGPVLGVIPATSFEEALRIATDTDYGLHATIFTKDIDRALYLARRLPCGTVSINKFTEGDVKTPFGGYRKSGSLARDNGAEALDQYLQTKTIWINVTPPS